MEFSMAVRVTREQDDRFRTSIECGGILAMLMVRRVKTSAISERISGSPISNDIETIDQDYTRI